MAGNTVKDMTTKFRKLDKFEGHDFRRWQKKMHFLLTTLKVVYVLTTPMPELLEDATVEAIRIREKWENDDYICRGHILISMSDSLFDVYTNVESAKELWDSLESKYMAEDSSSKKFLKKMHFLLTTLKVVYVLTTPMPELLEDATVEAIRIREKWENDDYICRGHILIGMSDSLFDVYTNVESAKELWDSLESKYMAEDSSSKKFLFPVIHQPPQEMSIQEMEDLKQQYLDEMKRLINSEYRDEIKIYELKENFNSMSIEINKKEKLQQLEQLANLSTYPSKCFNSFCYDDDDDEDYTIAVTPSLSTEEPNNSLSMGVEHLDIILVTESDEFIKSSVENLIPIPNEFEGGIDDDILLTIKDDILREKLLNINILIAKIEALNEDPTPSSDFMTNASTTTRYDISLPEYEALYDDHVKEISSGSTTTHSDSSLYDSFIFDLSINLFPPADRSDFYEFADELVHIISPPEYDCFLFKIEPNLRDFTMDVVEDISPIKEPRFHNALSTHPTLQLNLEFKPSSESLFTYVVWIFLPFLLYLVVPQYLLSLRNEDTIFDPGICNYHFFSFRPDVSIGVELS
nr:zinc finger, CCHC-type [Tanacetum cinerariifolium]